MMSPEYSDPKRLEQLIRKMISALERGREAEGDFVEVHPAVKDLSRQILKGEWNRVRDRIQPI